MMKHPKDLAIKDYTYDLPNEKIARYPLPERDQSKLLIYKNGMISTSSYSSIDQFIPSDTLLVFNNTKVVEARILFHKSTGSTIELFCLEPEDRYADITTAMLQKGKVYWKCLVGGAKKWKHEPLIKMIHHEGSDYVLNATKIEKVADYYIIEFSWSNTSLSFAEVLHHTGAIPLPPYLHRDAEESDKERYQTIYARHNGSVAAPTAGLHFTDNVFAKLSNKKIDHDFVTLHVGAGTFKPVKSSTMQDHEMHAEFIDVSKSFIERLILYADKKIVAVGTTSARTLESLYWIGVKLKEYRRQKIEDRIEYSSLSLEQWEAYDLASKNIPVKEALQSLLNWLNEQNTERLITKTQIIIAPGYEFKIIDGLVTNFHQPQSTLLLLVAALVGKDWKRIYDYALQNNFRFLSYGDGCLLWNKEITNL